MSELKERMLGQTMNEYGCDTKIYLKSEADKVIARNKYKRCLAMRNMCRYAQYSYSYLMENESCKILPNNIDFRRYNKKYHFYIRWRKRWLAIAEKFKPNSTAQQGKCF